MTEHQGDCSGGNETGGKFPIHCSIYTQEDNRQGGKDTNTVGDTTQSAMTQKTMTELVECNTTFTRLYRGSGAML